MKKNVLLTSMSIMVMAGAMAVSSCSKGNDVFDSNQNAANNHATVVEKYQAAFKAKFGDVSGETWDYSIRGGAKAQTRKKDKNDGGDYLTDWKPTNSYGYIWNYPQTASVTDPMHEDDVNYLVKNYWENTIKPAILGASVKPWAPSGSVVFRSFVTTRDASTEDKYFAWGAEIDGNDLYLRLASPANANDKKGGNTIGQHTSSIDFTKVPSTAIWYTCATTGQNKNKISINAADWKLQNFKEVTVTCKNKDNEDMECTFWCFQCHPSDNPTYTDLVMWVQKVPSVPSLTMQKRYMVEDLGGSDDFDFNDIVFDVYQFSDNTQRCFVRALGGTLGISIKVGNSTWSKAPTFENTEMLNTTAGNVDYSKSLADFGVTGWIPSQNNVSVTVTGKDGYTWEVVFPLTGEVPFIVATADGKEWMNERVGVPNIEWFGEPND
jgi:hypothetical protein